MKIVNLLKSCLFIGFMLFLGISLTGCDASKIKGIFDKVKGVIGTVKDLKGSLGGDKTSKKADSKSSPTDTLSTIAKKDTPVKAKQSISPNTESLTGKVLKNQGILDEMRKKVKSAETTVPKLNKK